MKLRVDVELKHCLKPHAMSLFRKSFLVSGSLKCGWLYDDNCFTKSCQGTNMINDLPWFNHDIASCRSLADDCPVQTQNYNKDSTIAASSPVKKYCESLAEISEK